MSSWLKRLMAISGILIALLSAGAWIGRMEVRMANAEAATATSQEVPVRLARIEERIEGIHNILNILLARIK